MQGVVCLHMSCRNCVMGAAGAASAISMGDDKEMHNMGCH
jgi:hypothetical protein